jgi:sigma-B regulation protein RsbU (phosphoserine phosphatase)
MFGQERLIATVLSNQDRSATQLADAIAEAVTKFQAGRDRFDDETVVVLRIR